MPTRLFAWLTPFIGVICALFIAAPASAVPADAQSQAPKVSQVQPATTFIQDQLVVGDACEFTDPATSELVSGTVAEDPATSELYCQADDGRSSWGRSSWGRSSWGRNLLVRSSWGSPQRTVLVRFRGSPSKAVWA
jgi:hypothetical protein